MDKYLQSQKIFPTKLLSSLAILVLLLLCAASAAAAEMSVNGFFTSDYVKTGVFQQDDAAEQSEAPEVTTISAQTAPAAVKPARKPALRRLYPGRFSKTTKGTERHNVENNEWDVTGLAR